MLLYLCLVELFGRLLIHLIRQFELSDEITHRAHIAVYPPKDMVVVEPQNRNDALQIWRMCTPDERTHGGYLVIAVSKQPTIIIARACVGIGIDQAPMPECGVGISQCEAVVTGHSFVHAQAVCQCNGLLRIANWHA